MEEAERYLKQALVEAEKGFGPKDAHVASSYNNLVRSLPSNSLPHSLSLTHPKTDSSDCTSLSTTFGMTIDY